MNIIDKNDKLQEGTFLYQLYYKNKFVENLYMQYLSSVAKIFIESEYSNKDLFTNKIFNIYGYLNWHVISVLNSTNPNFKDESEFKNNYNLILCLERYRELIKLIINNDKENILLYEDELGTLFE